jgi:hypothetical protein
MHIQALVSADLILQGFCWLTSTFNYKFSVGSGRTVGQFPTAQSFERKAHHISPFLGFEPPACGDYEIVNVRFFARFTNLAILDAGR